MSADRDRAEAPLVPGERITAGIVEYLRTGKAAGMVLPDAADTELNTLRVVALP